MNPRQRRGLLLLAFAGLGLLAVFALVAGYVSDVRAQVEPKVRVLALAKPAQPYKAITDDMLKTVEMPERWVPRTALRDPGQLIGLVPQSELSKDSILQEGMLSAPPDLSAGQREIAILVDAETGVAGKIGPGSIVDIVATYPRDERRPAESTVVVAGARIVDVGQATLKGGRGVQQGQAADPAQVVPVTFALTPRQQLQVTYAEAFASEVRLARLRPGEASELKGPDRTYRRDGDG